MSIHRLKQLMLILSVNSDGCSEKADLMARLRADARVEIRSDRNNLYYEEDELKTLNLCALRSLMKRHNVLPPSVKLGEKEARSEGLRRFQAAGMVKTSELHMCTTKRIKKRRSRQVGWEEERSKSCEESRSSTTMSHKQLAVQFGKQSASGEHSLLHSSGSEKPSLPERNHKKSFAQLVLESNPRSPRELDSVQLETKDGLVSTASTARKDKKLSAEADSQTSRSRSESNTTLLRYDTPRSADGSQVDFHLRPLDDAALSSLLQRGSGHARCQEGGTRESKPDEGEEQVSDNHSVACGSPVSFGDLAPSAHGHLDEDGEQAVEHGDAQTSAPRVKFLMRCYRSFLCCLPKSTRCRSQCTCA